MAPQGRRRETGYGTKHQELYQHWPRKRTVHRQKARWEALEVQVGITLALLSRRELQELKVRLFVLVLVNCRAWVVGHYNGGRHREALR